MVRKYKKSRQKKRKKTHRVRYHKKKKTRRRKKKKTRRRRTSKGGFIWTLPDEWETKLEDGEFMPQEWLDEHGKKRPGTVMNCATCVEMMAGIPINLGFILSIWSEHGRGVRPMQFLKFLNKYFSMKTKGSPLIIWTALTFKEGQWKKCEGRLSQHKHGGCKMFTGGKWKFDDPDPYREWETILEYYTRRRDGANYSTRGERQAKLVQIVNELPPKIYDTPRSLYLNPGEVVTFLNQIKQMLPNNSGVLTYIFPYVGGAHYMILAKDQNQLMYIDPQRKISFKGLDQIISEFESKRVFQLLLFIASPTYDTHKTDAKLAEKGMERYRVGENDEISFVINKKGFGHDVFKPKIIEIDKKFGEKMAPWSASDYDSRLSVRDIHNARLLKSVEATSSTAGGGGGGNSGVHYYSDSIPPWEVDRQKKWPWPPREGQQGWITPRQWKYSQKLASDFISKGSLLPLPQSWNRKRSVLSELEKKSQPKPKLSVSATASAAAAAGDMGANPITIPPRVKLPKQPASSTQWQQHNDDDDEDDEDDVEYILPVPLKYDCEIGECKPLKKFSQPNQVCPECWQSINEF